MRQSSTLSAAILDPMLRADPVGPRITYYDDATGERIELSGVTLANWAAKTGNLLRDELGAGPASRVAILLPAHWQTAAVLFGVWWIGAEAVLAGPADLALCTPPRLDEADATGEVAVLSLDPFGRPVSDLPIGVTDYATAVRVHGDQIVPEPRPGPALDGRSVDAAAVPKFRGGTGFDGGRPGAFQRVVAGSRRAGGRAAGDPGRRRLAGSGGQCRPGGAAAPDRIREGHPGAVSTRLRAARYILISLYFDVNVVRAWAERAHDRKVAAMAVYGLLAKAAGTVVTGLVGVTAYEVVRKAVAKAPLHETAVKGAELGLRGTRKAEEAAESARLKLADVMAEARERIGEETPTPSIADTHDHEH